MRPDKEAAELVSTALTWAWIVTLVACAAIAGLAAVPSQAWSAWVSEDWGALLSELASYGVI